MIQQFSENLIEIVMNAQEVARTFKQSEVNPSNLFLGLIQNKKSKAYKIINQHIDIGKEFKDVFEKIFNQSIMVSNLIEIPFSSDSKEILLEAVKVSNIKINKNISHSRSVDSKIFLDCILLLICLRG